MFEIVKGWIKRPSGAEFDEASEAIRQKAAAAGARAAQRQSENVSAKDHAQQAIQQASRAIQKKAKMDNPGDVKSGNDSLDSRLQKAYAKSETLLDNIAAVEAERRGAAKQTSEVSATNASVDTERVVERLVPQPPLAKTVDDAPSMEFDDRRGYDAPDVGYAEPAYRAPSYAAQGGGSYGGPQGPVVSLTDIFGSILKRWKSVLLCSLICGGLAAVYAKSLPNKYVSYSQVLVDPRSVKVLDNDLTEKAFSSEAMIAVVENNVQLLRSNKLIRSVIEEQGLLGDVDFGGREKTMLEKLPVVGQFFGPSLVREPGMEMPLAIREFGYALSVYRNPKTFVIDVGVTTTDPIKSARVANGVVQAFLSDQGSAQSELAGSASEALGGRIEELAEQLRLSEEAVEDYKSANGLVGAGGVFTDDVQLSRLNEQLATSRIETSNLLAVVNQLKQTRLADVLEGSLPEGIKSATLGLLRVQYSKLRQEAQKATSQLGPRHPDRIAAEASLSIARKDIESELNRIIAATSSNYRRAKRNEESLRNQVESLKANAVRISGAMVELRQLERKANSTRKVYEEFANRARSTSEQSKVNTINARVISEALPALEKVGPNRKVMVLGGMVVGALIGAILAMLRGLISGFGGGGPNGSGGNGRGRGRGEYTHAKGYGNNVQSAAGGATAALTSAAAMASAAAAMASAAAHVSEYASQPEMHQDVAFAPEAISESQQSGGSVKAAAKLAAASVLTEAEGAKVAVAKEALAQTDQAGSAKRAAPVPAENSEVLEQPIVLTQPFVTTDDENSEDPFAVLEAVMDGGSQNEADAPIALLPAPDTIEERVGKVAAETVAKADNVTKISEVRKSRAAIDRAAAADALRSVNLHMAG